MASTARAMLVITLPALAIGALAGLALRTTAPPVGSPTEPPPAPVQGTPAPTPHRNEPRAQRPVRDPGRRAKPAGEGPKTPTDRNGKPYPPSPPLEPDIASRLSDPSEAVRYACAAELLRMGTARLSAISVLAPTSPEGRALLDRVVNSLTEMNENEQVEDFWHMPIESRADLALTLAAKVVPLEYLAADRRRRWQMAVDADAARLAGGAMREGEAAWHRIELARARFDLREISEDAWKKVRDADLPAVRSWVTEYAAERGADATKVSAVRDAIGRLAK